MIGSGPLLGTWLPAFALKCNQTYASAEVTTGKQEVGVFAVSLEQSFSASYLNLVWLLSFALTH